MAGVALTPKERRFAQELPTSDSQTEAAIKAGYSPRSAHVQASRAIKKDKVLAAVSEEQNRLASLSDYTREQWEADVRRESEAGDKSQPSQARIAALNTIGKSRGWVVEKIVVVDADVAKAVIRAAQPFFEPGRVMRESDWDEFSRAVVAASKSL